MIEAKVVGFERLNRMFQDLPEEVGKKVLRAAVRKAARPMWDQAIRNAPVAYGDLRDSIKIRMIGSEGGTKWTALIYSRLYYARFVHNGVRTTRQRRGGKRHQVVIPAHPFFAQAFDQGKNAYVDNLRDSVAAGLKRVLSALVRGQKLSPVGIEDFISGGSGGRKRPRTGSKTRQRDHRGRFI